MSFESDLRDALRRKAPPADFTQGVMGAIERGESPAVPARPAARRSRLAAAAALFLLLGGGWSAHLVEEHREGERAKAQLMTALRLTSRKLQATQQHVQEISTR